MPANSEIANRQWLRFQQVRDNGHDVFVAKADICEAFFRGDQWSEVDRAQLAAVLRPALTINKIFPTVNNVLGEQISNRAEISFRPARGGTSDTADVLAKVFKQISNANQLDWRRSEMFADGAITSRGFLDARVEFTDSMQGDVKITNLNPKNVLIDPDGEDYDPDTWSDVQTSKWLTADDIAVTYSEDDAELLRGRSSDHSIYGYDSIDYHRDRFGQRNLPLFTGTEDMSAMLRNIRVIERQHRQLDRQKHFVEKATGDMRPIPKEFTRNHIAMFVDKFGFGVTEKLVRRIRWTVVADNIVLHDDWSPYKHFTVVPFFPIFRRGTTIGFVENLLGPQELLNKVSSQELHVVNTTANSGYKVKAGALANMTVEELQEKGAQTGIVIEVNGDPEKDVQRIQPNQVPQGLDRISYKAEESIKTISGVNDSMVGMDREDVSGKAIDKKKQAGSTNLVKPFDSLTRTDWLLARNVLDMVQEYYTEERILTITKDSATGENEEVVVNQANAAGQIVNDLTLGEYEVVVVSVPHRETMEDSQFDQAVAMKEMGIAIPDSVIVNASRLQNKVEIIRQMTGDQDSPEAKAAKALQERGQTASVSKLEGEAAQKHADAGLKQAKAAEVQVKTQKEEQAPPEAQDTGVMDHAVAEHSAGMAEQELEHKKNIDFASLAQKREADDNKLALQAHNDAEKRLEDRAKAAQQLAAEAVKPRKQTA